MNGQGVWMAFKANDLGTSQLDGITNQANLHIESLIYSGEKNWSNFWVPMSNFKKAHLDLVKAGNVTGKNQRLSTRSQDATQ